MERAVELKEKFAGAWSDLAEAYSDIDEFGKALDAVQRVIKLQPARGEDRQPKNKEKRRCHPSLRSSRLMRRRRM